VFITGLLQRRSNISSLPPPRTGGTKGVPACHRGCSGEKSPRRNKRPPYSVPANAPVINKAGAQWPFCLPACRLAAQPEMPEVPPLGKAAEDPAFLMTEICFQKYLYQNNRQSSKGPEVKSQVKLRRVLFQKQQLPGVWLSDSSSRKVPQTYTGDIFYVKIGDAPADQDPS